MAVRNITLSLSEDLIRKAKVFAAERDTSISALVSSLLATLVSDPGDYDDAWAEEEKVMAEGMLRIGPISWTRTELHER